LVKFFFLILSQL